MAVNVKSLQGRLLNVAREQGIEFQLLLHRFGTEQFLFRLSQSPYKDKFVFKGGSLLSYVIETDRKTRDLDFSIKQMKNQGKDLPKIIQSILEIAVDDGIMWDEIKHSELIHPDMAYPGIRIVSDFLLGEMRGQVRMDLAIEDVVKLQNYAAWLKNLPGIPVFVGYPVSYDFMFVYWYLIRFTGESPFSHSALDIKTLAMVALKSGYREVTKKTMPTRWFDQLQHSHCALDDAIEQGALFCNILAEIRSQSTG